MMNIHLEKVTYNARLSGETSCFAAVVCIDGVPAFEVSNRGCGGADLHRALPADRDGRLMEEGLRRIREYAATLPPLISHGVEITHNCETLVGKALDDWREARARGKFLRALKTKAIAIIGGKMWEYKPRAGHSVEDTIKAIRLKHPDARILNLLGENDLWTTARPFVWGSDSGD